MAGAALLGVERDQIVSWQTVAVDIDRSSELGHRAIVIQAHTRPAWATDRFKPTRVDLENLDELTRYVIGEGTWRPLLESNNIRRAEYPVEVTRPAARPGLLTTPPQRQLRHRRADEEE